MNDNNYRCGRCGQDVFMVVTWDGPPDQVTVTCQVINCGKQAHGRTVTEAFEAISRKVAPEAADEKGGTP